MKIKYWCYYTFQGKREMTSSENGLQVFRDGFWINNEGDFTTGEDAKIWIPPSKIDYIVKIPG
jgi:hypothetical protein